MQNLSTLKVLVTGCSQGIGLAISQRLKEDGYFVVGLDRNPPQDNTIFDGFYQVDMINTAQLDEILITVLKEHQGFYGLVNNAGIIEPQFLGEVTDDTFYKVVDLNIKAIIHCTQAVLPYMKEQQKGRIVSVSSRAALGKAERTVYSMTKAGLIGMSRTWALEVGADGVTVNTVAPGPIRTPLFDQANPPGSPITEKIIANIPVKRMGLAEDVAHGVAYFMDQRSGFVTGQNLYVCGGKTIAQ